MFFASFCWGLCLSSFLRKKVFHHSWYVLLICFSVRIFYAKAGPMHHQFVSVVYDLIPGDLLIRQWLSNGFDGWIYHYFRPINICHVLVSNSDIISNYRDKNDKYKNLNAVGRPNHDRNEILNWMYLACAPETHRSIVRKYKFIPLKRHRPTRKIKPSIRQKPMRLAAFICTVNCIYLVASAR